jgi:hypothetical protein
MNVLPGAGPSALFSDAIVCRFRLRPASIAATGASTAFPFGDEELTIACAFETPRKRSFGAVPIQHGTCSVTTGLATHDGLRVTSTGPDVPFMVHDPEGGSADGLRVFAGRRSDPFFLDLKAIQTSMATGRLCFSDAGTNTGQGANVLSVVVEVPCERLPGLGHGSLFAVAAETVVEGKLPIRLERVGRPEIKNVLLAPRAHDALNRDIELRDLYNLEDPYHQSKAYRRAYRARLSGNLAHLDSLDGSAGWPLAAPSQPGARELDHDDDLDHPLTSLLLADYLLVDVSKPFAPDSFFEIERAALEGRRHQTCGGRSLDDDVMDTLFTLLIGGLHGPRLSDHVDRPTVPSLPTFPYLAPPNAPTRPGVATQPGVPTQSSVQTQPTSPGDVPSAVLGGRAS